MPESTRVIDGFQKKVAEASAHHSELLLAVYGKRRQLSLETRLIEQFVMSIAVLWESFINDLIIAYVIEHPESCLRNIQERINQSISEKFGSLAAKKIRFIKLKKLSRAQALALIDPKGMNITAKTADNLSARANALLIASDARKFSLNAEDRVLIDLLLSIRNYLDHKSSMSCRF